MFLSIAIYNSTYFYMRDTSNYIRTLFWQNQVKISATLQKDNLYPYSINTIIIYCKI